MPGAHPGLSHYSMSSLAIIPARGGSKRIERKNIKEFAGVPVIAYSIRAALDSGCFDEVMVSTDDKEIADVAMRYGARVPFLRSAETANDYATTADVIREVLDCYRAGGREFDVLACIYATAPFVTAERLAEAFAMLAEGRAQAAFTCVEYSYPIQRSLAIGPDGRIGMKYPQYATARSQDLEKSYHDAGQFYLTTARAFEECGSLWGPDTLPVVLPETEVQDLDTPTDWALAEMKYTLLSMPRRIMLEGYELVAYPELDAATSERLRQGRNEPDVRRRMVNDAEISAESHRRFVEGLALRRDKQYYAVYALGAPTFLSAYENRESDSKPLGAPTKTLIGSVTLERVGADAMERGIWLFDEARGHGHARLMLRRLYDWLRREKGIARIVTRVKTDNDASLALENSLGARAVGEADGLRHFELTTAEDDKTTL